MPGDDRVVRGVRSNLATWKLPADARMPVQRAGSPTIGPLRWAVAAAVLLAAGYGVARMTERPATIDLAAGAADLVRDVRQEVRQELATELTKHTSELTAAQREFQAQVIDAMDKIETRQVVNQATMRKDVETLAVHTQAEFNRWLTIMADATVGQRQRQRSVVPTAQ